MFLLHKINSHFHKEQKGASINHVDSEGGRGGSWKNHVGPQGGEGVLEAFPRGQNFSQTTAQNAVLLREFGVFIWKIAFWIFVINNKNVT